MLAHHLPLFPWQQQLPRSKYYSILIRGNASTSFYLPSASGLMVKGGSHAPGTSGKPGNDSFHQMKIERYIFHNFSSPGKCQGNSIVKIYGNSVVEFLCLQEFRESHNCLGGSRHAFSACEFKSWISRSSSKTWL